MNPAQTEVLVKGLRKLADAMLRDAKGVRVVGSRRVREYGETVLEVAGMVERLERDRKAAE